AVMLFALLPAGIVGAVESAPVEYVFSGPAIGLEDGTSIMMKSGSAADGNGKGMNDIVSTISAPWDLLAYRSCTGGRYRPEGISCNTEGTLGIAFSIEVKEKGTFIPTVHFDYAATGVIVSVYIFDEAEKTSRGFNMSNQNGIKALVESNMKPIGSFDTYRKGADSNKFAEGEKDEKSFDPITLNKGTYYVVFSKSGENSALEGNTAARCIQLRGLTLTEAPPDVKVEKVTYDFRKGPYNKGVDNVDDYSLTENWKFHSMEEGLWESYLGSYKVARFLNYGIQLQSGKDEWLALTLNIPSSGFYIPDFKYAVGPSGSMGDIYLAPAQLPSVAWFNDAYHIGEVNFKHSGDFTENREKELLTFKVNTAGEYVLVLKSRNGALYPTSLTLTSAEVTGAEVLFEEEYLRVGATERVSMKIATSKDRYVDVIGAAPTFKSSNDSIATVAEDGTIVGVGEGAVTITAETTVYGEKLIGSKTIEVKNISYSHADMNITEGEAFFVGNRKELTASGYFSDGSKIDDEDITVRYESSNENVVKIENGVLCAEGEGEAKITAYVKFGEEEKSVERTVRIERVKLSYITAKTEDNVVSSFDADGSKIIVTGINNDGSIADISGAVY
ncbi:MAG: hypothetical protein IJ949_02500, partial [Oscillospiraceae bacterium]|nr:hypothetical protein [Oscillospiraceae bacterium]